MRLINLDTLQIEDFTDPPPFAILSHTWADGEVTLQDVANLPRASLASRPGWIKILGFRDAVKAQLQRLAGQTVSYGWVDTCCIDKTSSAELSEAINSMFRWGASGFEQCRWFTRGWTLQELIAPRLLFFFDEGWEYIGDKHHWTERIALITGIVPEVIQTGAWDSCCVAERMAWAARRTTSRAEDMAYCLMGIFNVNMPLLYGEGGEKASIRLQEEILKDSEDQSIFAWDTSSKGDDIRQIGALTTSPSLFHSGGAMEAIPTFESQIALTSKGAHASFPIMTLDGGRKVALLACRFETDMDSIVGIPVQHELGGTMPSSPAFYSSGGTNITPTPFPITTAPYMVSRSASNMQVYSRQRRAPGLVTISLTAPRRLSQAVCLLKRDQPIGTPNRRRLKCWLCYGTLSAVFGPMEDRWYTLGWNISPGGMMTRLFARQRKSIAVPFVQHLQPENRLSFCIVLDIRPGRVHVDEGDVDIVHVGLAALYEEASAGYSLDEQMEHVLARVDGIAIADEAQLVDASTGSIIRASIATIEDGSIFQINLSREKPRSV